MPGIFVARWFAQDVGEVARERGHDCSVLDLPNARGEERSDGRVRTMVLLVPSVLAIRVGSLSLRSRLTHGSVQLLAISMISPGTSTSEETFFIVPSRKTSTSVTYSEIASISRWLEIER